MSLDGTDHHVGEQYRRAVVIVVVVVVVVGSIVSPSCLPPSLPLSLPQRILQQLQSEYYKLNEALRTEKALYQSLIHKHGSGDR